MLRCRDMCFYFNMILLVIVSLLGYSLCEESPKYPENTADISSINNLAYKPPVALDPKIRKALLNVLNRLEEEEKTTESGHEKSASENHEHQKPSSDDIKWLFKTNDTYKIYHSPSDDVKWEFKVEKFPSHEEKWEQKSNESPSDDGKWEHKSNKSPSDDGKWEYKVSNSPPHDGKWEYIGNDTFKEYHSPSDHMKWEYNAHKSSDDEKWEHKNKSPSDHEKWGHETKSPSDHVKWEYKAHKSPSDDEKWEHKPKSHSGDESWEHKTKSHSDDEKWEHKPKPHSDDEKWEHKPKSPSDDGSWKHKFSDSSPHDLKWEYKANNTFREFTYYQMEHDEHDKHSSTSPKSTKDDSHTESSASEEPEALFFQIPEHEKDDSGKEKHESLNLQETKSVISPEELFSHLEDEEAVKEKKHSKSNDSSSSSKPDTSEDKVEFFQAPLLTAFTLEQDERGLPRRIIPLDTDELKSILNNKLVIDPSQEPRKAREPQAHSEPSPSHNEHKKIQINLESQLLELQEQKRQLDLEKQKFLLEQEKQRLLIEQENTRRLKHALELKEKEHFFRSIKQNEIPRPEVFLQKSIPLEVHHNPVILQPALPFTRIQYHNKPHFEFPETVDRQLLTLFHRSGIHQGKHEDLNIVSKVLALNYDENDKPKISTDRILNVRESFRNKRRLIDNPYRN